MRLHRDILFIGVAKNSRYDGAATDGARLAEKDWEGLRMAENDWVARSSTTARLRDCETARPRDCETTGLRDYGTTGRRDDETTRPLKNTAVLRRSQSFSGILSRAWQCEAECYTTLPSEMNFCQKGLDVALSRRLTGWGCTWAYIPIQADGGSAADSLLSQKLLDVRVV